VRLARNLLPATLAALGVAGCLGLAVAPAARADAGTTLSNVSGFHQMVVDNTDGYIFISEGTAKGLAVVKPDGSYVTTLEAGDDVEGIVLSGGTLYAALRSQDEVAVIDAATLAVGQPYALPAGDDPYSLAVQSGMLWVSYLGSIGDIDLSTGTFEAASVPYTFPTPAYLASDPSDKGVLVAASQGMSPETIGTFSTTTVPATTIATAIALACSNEGQLAVLPGGTQFVIACGGASSGLVYDTDDLSAPASSYPTFPHLDAVAVASDGSVALGDTSNFSPAAYVFDGADGSLRNVFQMSWVADRGLAWGAGDSVLYAVSGSAFGTAGPYVLHVFGSPTLTTSTLTFLGPPSPTPIAWPAEFGGSLSLGTGIPPAGTAVTITRRDPDGGTVTLPAATTDADGNFLFSQQFPVPGTYTYTASYGDGVTTAKTQESVKVAVTPDTASLRLDGPSGILPEKGFTLSGTLSFASGSAAAGKSVTVVRKNPNGTTSTFTAKTGSTGAFTVSDKLPAPGAYTYTANYSSATSTTATAKATVTAAKASPALTLAAGSPTASYDSTIHLTAHLGSTYSNRTVSIYAQPAGATARKLLKTATVNSSGNLAISYPAATRNVTFSAAFSGDAQYLAKSVSVRVGVGVRVAMASSGFYTSAKYNGITFYVYHHTARLSRTVTVTPSKAGEHLELVLQQWQDNSWTSKPAKVFSGTLNSKSQDSGYLTLSTMTGGRFRIRAVFVPARADVTNVSTATGWFYFSVVK
jgi:hypothetical protein